MVGRITKVAGTVAVACGLAGAVGACSGSDDEPRSPAAEAAVDLPTVTDFSVDAGDACAYDAARGGLVHEDLTVTSTSTGVLELSFYVQRGSADDVLPGHVTTVLRFDELARARTFDLVLPVTRAEHEAGYDECRWSTGAA